AADEKLWQQEKWSEITITPKRWGVYPQYFGHSIWLGPQDAWYNQQDIYDYMHNKTWPPDKHLNLTEYSITNQSTSSITVQSPHSPVSGLSLQKNYRLVNNTVQIEVTAKNISDKNLRWNLWSLCRVPGDTHVWCHADNTAHYVSNANSKNPSIRMQVHKDWAYLDQSGQGDHRQTKGSLPRVGKYATGSSTPVIAAFQAQNLILISFNHVSVKDIPPGHSLIEIFQAAASKDQSFIELEHHDRYTRLAPGESMQLQEQWEIIPIPQALSIEQEYVFIQEALNKND
ncbi:MAG: DUF4380 domain-containing protein, partial [Planctomycetes bacterium]|nr:DUF4380 domain-containing protein [Planctomycetota bacterium]